MTGREPLSREPDSYEMDFGDQRLTAAEQDRLVSGPAEAAGRGAEAALRPKGLQDFIGQPQVREQLSLVLDAAKARSRTPDHVLLSGPPGLGKTTLAMIIAHEMQASLRVTSGPAVQHAGDLAAILSSLEEGEVLFIDEIPLDLPPFTLVGATTRSGLLPAPLRDRFGFTGHLDFYSSADLLTVLKRSARMLGIDAQVRGLEEISTRSRGTPRIAIRLLRRVRDWAQVRGSGVIDEAAALNALTVYEVDELGLDRLDRSVLDVLCRRFGGGPVGLGTLSVSVGEEADTVETVSEPYLVREGLISRTPRGRVATSAAWRHLGLHVPANYEF